MLAARARGTKRVDLQVSRVDVDLDLLGFGHYGYSYGRGVYAALCLCLRHALYAVHAAFKFKVAVRPLSLDGEAHFLHTAQLEMMMQPCHPKHSLLCRLIACYLNDDRQQLHDEDTADHHQQQLLL